MTTGGVAHIVVDGTRDEADTVRLVRLTSRAGLRLLRVAGLILAVLGLAAIVSPETLGFAVGTIILGVGLGLFLRTFLSPRRMARKLPKTAHLPRTIEVTPEYIQATTALTVMRWSWPALTRVAEADGYWLFYAGPVVATAIARHRLTPEQEAWLRQLVAARGADSAAPARSGDDEPSVRASIPDRGE